LSPAAASSASGARTKLARAPPAARGLGVAIAKGLVQAHGGAMWAENRSSGGARVPFTLPLA
jgi:two-component system sensor histidine kinase KdpD